MKIQKSTLLVVAALLFILISGGIVVLVLGIGKEYRRGISDISGEPQPKKLTIFRRDEVRKIIVKKGAGDGCMEITPDGVVRLFSTCGVTLVDASRLSDSKNILKLFKIITEEDLTTYQQKTDGLVYEITIETDSGSKTIYVALGGGSDGIGQTIIGTIDDITEDIPQASPSQGSTPTPTQSLFNTSTPTPTGTIFVPTPTPTTQVGGAQTSFTCGFTESGGTKKPFNISNIVCSTEPSPVP